MGLLTPGTQRRLNELVGFLWVVAALLTLLSLLSYKPEDPSLNTAGMIYLPESGSEGVRNWAGVVGSYLADLLIQGLGYAAFLVPAGLAFVGWRWLRGKAFESPRQFVGGAALLFISVTALLGLTTAMPPVYGLFPAGGLSGAILASALTSLLNTPGSYLIAFTGLVVGTFLSTPFTFSGAGEWAREAIPAGAGASWRLPRFSFNLPTVRLRPQTWSSEHAKPQVIKRVALAEVPAEPSLPPPPPKSSFSGEIKSVIRPLPPKPEPKESRTSRVLSIFMPREKETAAAAEPAQSRDTPAATRKSPSASKPARPAPIIGSRYRLPSTSLLHTPQQGVPPNESELQTRSELLVEKLQEFSIAGEVVQINPGPVVTTFEFRPEAGVKLSRITNMAEDLCLALRAESILIDRIPGKSTVGIEVPNDNRETIVLREIIEARDYAASDSKLTLPLGKDLAGKVQVADLTKMPHLLFAGATGTGKSVAVNSFIVSILYKATPDEVKLILIDPKRLELGLYADIPHLFTPIVTEPRVASNVLRNAVREMERRLKLLAKYGVRHLTQFNQLFEKEETRPGVNEKNEEGEELNPLPYLVIIIDELADLMMVESNNVEASITRLAQMARAVGIHLVLATQRPSVDVITGLIKANFPARISFRVATRTDSRTILDGNGAESLLGMGDMLYLPAGSSRLHRIHGPFVSEKETTAICNFWRSQGNPDLNEEFLKAPPGKIRGGGVSGENFNPSEDDDLYDEAVSIAYEMQKASTSTLQRRLRIGYGRAARLIDMMEQAGLVGPSDGPKPREVLKKRDPVNPYPSL